MSRRAILLVEDDPEDAELTRMALEDVLRRYALKIARDGEEALRCLLAPGEALPALILLDLNLPRQGGLEVLERLNEAWGRGLKGAQIAVLSSSYEPKDRLLAEKLGAAAYLRKPIGADETKTMVQAVASLLRGPA